MSRHEQQQRRPRQDVWRIARRKALLGALHPDAKPTAYMPPAVPSHLQRRREALRACSDVSSESDNNEAVRHGPETVASTMATPSRCSCCGCGGRRAITTTRKSSQRKQMQTLIDHPDNTLSQLQRDWLHTMFLPMVERTEYHATDYRQRHGHFRKVLIILGAIITTLILLEKTSLVASYATAATVVWVTGLVLSIVNNVFGAFVTDFKYIQRAVMYTRGQGSLSSLFMCLIFNVQRYSGFATPHAAFKTFVRDVVTTQQMIIAQETSLMYTSEAEKQTTTDALVAKRLSWADLMNRLPVDEALAMNEISHTNLAKREEFWRRQQEQQAEEEEGAVGGLRRRRKRRQRHRPPGEATMSGSDDSEGTEEKAGGARGSPAAAAVSSSAAGDVAVNIDDDDDDAASLLVHFANTPSYDGSGVSSLTSAPHGSL